MNIWSFLILFHPKSRSIYPNLKSVAFLPQKNVTRKWPQALHRLSVVLWQISGPLSWLVSIIVSFVLLPGAYRNEPAKVEPWSWTKPRPLTLVSEQMVDKKNTKLVLFEILRDILLYSDFFWGGMCVKFHWSIEASELLLNFNTRMRHVVGKWSWGKLKLLTSFWHSFHEGRRFHKVHADWAMGKIRFLLVMCSAWFYNMKYLQGAVK